MKVKKNSAYKMQMMGSKGKEFHNMERNEKFNIEDFDDDKSSETASSKEPK